MTFGSRLSLFLNDRFVQELFVELAKNAKILFISTDASKVVINHIGAVIRRRVTATMALCF